MIDLDAIDEAHLVEWAKARIAADAELIEAELDRNSSVASGASFDIGLSAIGAVIFRDPTAGSVYTIAPGDIIGQTFDGRRVALRDGREVVPSNRRDAAPLN